MIQTWKDHSGDITAIAISSDGQTIVSGSKDETIRVWDIANLERIEPINIIKLCNLETGKLIFDLGEEGSRVAFSPDGRTIVDNVIHIWPVPGR